jgi:hypothetical protein
VKGIQKRSVSPFGTGPNMEADAFTPLAEAIRDAFGPAPEEPVRKFTSSAHIPAVPARVRKAAQAPANDVPWLDEFCAYLVRMRPEFEEKGAARALWEGMERLFERKTELFLVDHLDREQCQKLGWADDHKDLVLFARERDILVGRFFAGWTEREPGDFSAFIHRWTDSPNPDRILHLLDFCAGSKNPTFEHYLLFTHPALARWVGNKTQLRALFDRVRPVLAKLKSPTWEKDVRHALGV